MGSVTMAQYLSRSSAAPAGVAMMVDAEAE